MIETVQRKRIEILVDTPLVSRVVQQIKACDISGWSLIHVDAGGGRDGQWRHDEVTGASAKTIILVITSEEKAALLADKIAPWLNRYGMLLTIGDVQVIRGERF